MNDHSGAFPAPMGYQDQTNGAYTRYDYWSTGLSVHDYFMAHVVVPEDLSTSFAENLIGEAWPKSEDFEDNGSYWTAHAKAYAKACAIYRRIHADALMEQRIA